VIRYALRYNLSTVFRNYILIRSEFQVNSRLYAKRSSIGSRAVQVVEDFFKGGKFDAPSDIMQYAKWAVRGGGPALWRVPTPWNGKHDSESQSTVRCIILVYTLIADLEIHNLCTLAGPHRHF
jgi:hypothetical protein